MLQFIAADDEEPVMERFDFDDEVIELGSATAETRGSMGTKGDENGLHLPSGISDD